MLAIFSNNLFVIYLIFDIYLSLFLSLVICRLPPSHVGNLFLFSSSNNIFLSFILLFNICLSLCLSCHLQATTLPCWQYLFISQTFWRQTDFLLLHHPSLSPLTFLPRREWYWQPNTFLAAVLLAEILATKYLLAAIFLAAIAFVILLFYIQLQPFPELTRSNNLQFQHTGIPG